MANPTRPRRRTIQVYVGAKALSSPQYAKSTPAIRRDLFRPYLSDKWPQNAELSIIPVRKVILSEFLLQNSYIDNITEYILYNTWQYNALVNKMGVILPYQPMKTAVVRKACFHSERCQ